MTYDPVEVARIAASLLDHRGLDIGHHHARIAVASAILLVDEANAQCQPDAGKPNAGAA